MQSSVTRENQNYLVVELENYYYYTSRQNYTQIQVFFSKMSLFKVHFGLQFLQSSVKFLHRPKANQVHNITK